MGIRLSGLSSGMDTDTIIKQLMSAQSYRKTKIESKQTKLEWKQEIWSELNTKIYNFYTNTLSKMRLQATFKTKAATSSDTSKVTATAGSNAAEGTYKVKIENLASAQYVTSGKLDGAWEVNEFGNYTGDTTKVTSSTKLVDILKKVKDEDGIESEEGTFKAGTQIVVSGSNGTSTLLIDEDTKVSDFIKTCQNAGLTASFDEGQQRFFIGSGESGEEQKFTITSGALTQSQLGSIRDWKDAVGYEYLSSTDKAAVSKIFDQLQAGKISEADANEALKPYVETSKETAVNEYYKKKAAKEYEDYFTYDADHEKTGVTQKGLDALLASGKTQEQIDKMTDAKALSEVNALVDKKVTEALNTQEYKDNIKSGIANGISGESDTFLSRGVSAGLTDIASAVTNFVREMESSKIADNSTVALSGFGMGAIDEEKLKEGEDWSDASTGMAVVAAKDAIVYLNGARLESPTSTLTVNGLTLNLLEETGDREISISVTKDTSEIYDTVKDFISEYNDILKTMNTYYNAASARGYDVLTSDQKEAMSEKEIELWENKIKDSLLRRDDTLGNIISSFRTDMLGSFTASNGKRYSLASLGISTSAKDWQEGGLLHIHGDEDDSEYMDSENKLQAMLAQDPELVMEILNGLADNLYGDLQKKMGHTSMSSAFTFYNDKEMNSQLSDYKKQISDWEAKLADIEDRYYKQFTAMEKAMAQLNSQQNSFANMLG